MNAHQPSRSFRHGACQKCGGDGFFDLSGESEWRCLQCGRSLAPYSPLQAEARSFRMRANLELRMDKESVTTEATERRIIRDGKPRLALGLHTASRKSEEWS